MGVEIIDIGGAVYGQLDFRLTGKFSSTCNRWSFEGEITADSNMFDFDPKDWGVRGGLFYWKEIATRAIGIVGSMSGAQRFMINFEGGRKVSDGGSL